MRGWGGVTMRFSPAWAVCVSLFWAIALVGLPVVAYWLSGGPLTPGWALFPTTLAIVLFLLFYSFIPIESD